jgi:hypothetical protein
MPRFLAKRTGASQNLHSPWRTDMDVMVSRLPEFGNWYLAQVLRIFVLHSSRRTSRPGQANGVRAVCDNGSRRDVFERKRAI